MPDSTTAETARPNKVTVSDAGPCRKKVTIEIPAESVDERLTTSMDTLGVEAQVPGFRRGRAPRQLLERRFGTMVRAEARNQLVADAFARAVEEHKLKVIGDPVSPGLDKLELAAGQPVRVDLEVEVLPEFDLGSLEGLKVRRPVLDVTDEMVDQELQKLRINEGRLETREAPQAGDYLTGHGVMKGPDGHEFYNIKGCVVQVPTADRAGKGMILGVVVDDFAAQLGLPGPGQTASLRVRGPEHHEVEAIRGVDLSITFTVDRVDRIIPAEAADLVSRFGFENEEAMRGAVRDRMQQRVAVQQATALRQQVARQLVERTAMELPARVTAQQAARALERRRLELMYRGVEPQQIEEHMAELRASSAEVARRELKLFFILNRAAEALGVEVSEGEMNGRIAQMAAMRNLRPDRLKQELAQHNRLGGVFQQIREHKTMDAILAKADVTDVSAEEFAKSSKGDA